MRACQSADHLIPDRLRRGIRKRDYPSVLANSDTSEKRFKWYELSVRFHSVGRKEQTLCMMVNRGGALWIWGGGWGKKDEANDTC